MKKILLGGLLLVTSLFAGGERFHDFAKVTYSEPIYEYVYDSRPHRECQEVRYKTNNNRYYGNNNNSLGIDTLIGAAAGVALGNQIGKGNGRVAARVVGGLLGAKVANDIRGNYRVNDNYYDNRYETKTECYDVEEQVERKAITGYKNYFVYKGEEHFKISDRPLRRVKITHTINF